MNKGKEILEGYSADNEQYTSMQKFISGENHPSTFGDYNQYNHTFVWTPPYSSSDERYARAHGMECYPSDNDPYISITPELSDCPTKNSMQQYFDNRPVEFPLSGPIQLEQVQSRAPPLIGDSRRYSDVGPSRYCREPMIKMNAELYEAWKDDWREKLKRTRSLQDRNDRLIAENKKLRESIKESNKSMFKRLSKIWGRVVGWAQGKSSTSETIGINHRRSNSGNRHRRH